jgi:caffeoyl-CoA O-methyltransferase
MHSSPAHALTRACIAQVRVGGVIAVDNTLWYGRVADPAETDKQTSALREFNARVLADQRVAHVMVPIGDGLTLLRRRV